MGASLSAVRPVRRVYLGLAADPYDALSTVVWTEITKVFTSTIRWGAQHELARVEPSYCSLLLDNSAGDFEALNPASPYYPNLRPLNRLRIVDTWAGIDYIRFTGYVTDWPRSWTGIGQAVVQLEAYDALGAVLHAVDIPLTPWELQVRRFIDQAAVAGGKAVWLRLNETSGTLAADSSGFALEGQYQGSPTLGVDGLVPESDDKAFAPTAGSRVSLPYKNLVTGYPFTVSFKFKAAINRGAIRVIFYATDGPMATPNQWLQVYIDWSGGLYPGQLRATIHNGTADLNIRSSAAVDDGFEHHAVIAWDSAASCRMYIDGADVTVVGTATSPAFPNDLSTGYAVGNTPAVAFGDFRFALSAVDDVLDEFLVLDGVALSAGDVDDLFAAGIFVPVLAGFFGTSGRRLEEVLAAVGWPAADTDIDIGLTLVQQNYVAGKLNAYMQRLEVTEGGRLFVNGAGQIVFQDRHAVLQAPYTVSQATFGEDHAAGEIGYVGPFNHGEDDADIYNDIPVGNVGGVVQHARSLTSRARHGWKTLSGLTDLLGRSNEEARDRANRDLALYSEPVTRIRSITIKPQEDAAQGTVVWPKLLGLGQNSRVTVKAQPPGAAMITQESHVERLEETVTPADWQITLGLSAAQTVEAWIVGTSALDSGTRLAY